MEYHFDRKEERQGDPLCEREREVAEAGEAVTQTAAGEGRLLIVEGPPGIGKTRLLEATADIANRAGLEVYWARGDEFESRFSYGVLRQLLRPCLRRLDPSVRAVALGGPVSGLVALVEGTSTHRALTTDDDALSASHGLYLLMQDFSTRTPLALCVDDAHWADAQSLEALSYLARRIDGMPLLLAISSRAQSDGRAGALLERFRAMAYARRLAPGPLSEDAVRTLVRFALGREPDPAFSTRLRRTTGGNPFLVRELLASLGSGDVGWQEVGSLDLERVVPEPVTQSVLRRVTSAGPAESRLAEVVAVLGDATAVDAATLAELEEAEAVAAADRLIAADVLAPGPRLRFAHPILRGAVRAGIPPTRLALAQARAARLLEGRGAPLERIAAHLVESLPRGDPWAVKTLIAAAAEEASRGNPDTAISLLLRAREEPPPAHLRHRCTLALAKAQAAGNHSEALATARAAVASAGDPAEEAEAALHLVRTLGVSGDLWSALDLLHEWTAKERGIDADLALQLEAELLGIARLRPDLRDEAVDRLEQLASRALPARPASRVLLANLALSALERNDSPNKIADFAQSALAGEWPVEDVSFQLVYAFEALVWSDHLDEAATVCNAAQAAARKTNSLALSAFAHIWRSVVSLRRAEIPDAEADARIGFELATGGGASWRKPYARTPLADALMMRGELEEAARVLGDIEPEEQAESNPFYLDARGRLRLAWSEPGNALRDFLACGETLSRRGGVDAPAAFPWRSQAALALRLMGEERDAHRMATEELSLATKGQVPGAVAEALIAVGMVEDGEAGISRLHRALQILEESPRLLTRIRATTELGAMLRRSGQPRAAREYLGAALDLAHRHGAIALADRAREELLVAGGRPRRAARSGLDALTPSERRVAQLVAQGLTNRQIAHALVVSQRTVTTHLTHIYQKLGIPGRAELAAVLGAKTAKNVAPRGPF